MALIVVGDEERRDAAKSVDSIYLAADPDREGEAICWHLQEELKWKKGDKRSAADSPKFFRVMFNEITKNSVQKAFEKPASVNINLVAFSRLVGSVEGQGFAIFIITDAAAEAAVGLGIIIAFFRNRETVLADEMDILKW